MDVSMSWSDRGPTPYAFYHDMLAGQYFAPIGQSAGAANWSRWHSPAMDKLLSEFRRTTSSRKQHTLVDQMQRLFVSKLPAIPLVIGPIFYQYNTTSFTGFPTKKDYYAAGSPTQAPDRLLIMTEVKPKR
jgi:peptide/nickel transport system substrate-binding protein